MTVFFFPSVLSYVASLSYITADFAVNPLYVTPLFLSEISNARKIVAVPTVLVSMSRTRLLALARSTSPSPPSMALLVSCSISTRTLISRLGVILCFLASQILISTFRISCRGVQSARRCFLWLPPTVDQQCHFQLEQLLGRWLCRRPRLLPVYLRQPHRRRL